MQIFVEAVGVIAPGFCNWEEARSVLAGERPFIHRPLVPPVASILPAIERRRSSPTVRLAIAAVEQAIDSSALLPQEMAMVFASAEASGITTHQLCEVLAGSREVSPTQFNNSVHNAPSGYYSIAMSARRGATSVCRGRWTFAAGLLAASVQALIDNMPVLYVCYDSPLPFPLSEAMPVKDATAIAMVLSPMPIAYTVGAWNVIVDSVAEALPWPAWMPEDWRANASARGFAALTTLAVSGCSASRLPLSPELALQLSPLQGSW